MKLLPMERVTTHTLLGIRFWDRLTNQVVADGLQVKAQRLNADQSQRLGKPVFGRATPSGTIAFFGLTAGERPIDPDQLPWGPEVTKEPVVIDLVDRSNRFLPMSFVVQVPFKGVFRGQGDRFRPEAIAEDALGVQLWSAPTRPIPPGMAVIRAQIVIGEDINASPAANALVQVRTTPDSSADSSEFNYYGLTDNQGILLLLMPYPPIPDPPIPDPPAPGTPAPSLPPFPPLEQLTFPLNLTIYYSPDRIVVLPGSDTPDIESLLIQRPANIAIRRTNSDLEFQVNLRFGRPLIFGTALNTDSTEVESVLRIQQIQTA